MQKPINSFMQSACFSNFECIKRKVADLGSENFHHSMSHLEGSGGPNTSSSLGRDSEHTNESAGRDFQMWGGTKAHS